ncbi:DUF2267 domain-containing protein [Rugosimonospora acidiphila]|uniref:DUF2267 domain-containing protein n=1 Tax=Rugosimonospora acidiphila TaxID=556531 RepID=A0ABP9SL53_9ACTN
MRYDQFLAQVRERGEYADRNEAEWTTQVVLRVLADRLTAQEAEDLAAQLPDQAANTLTAYAGDPETFSVHEFLRRIAEVTGATERTAQWDASAVLSTVADGVSGGEVKDVLGQLPSGYSVLFGKSALGG